MSKVLNNTTGSDVFVIDVGTNIPASSSYTIPFHEYASWADSANVVTLITAGTLTLTTEVRLLPTVALAVACIQDLEGIAENLAFDNASNGFTSVQVQAAIEEAKSTGGANFYFGDGSDGNVSLSSGTTTLSRTMYYNNLTLSGSAIIDANGFKIYVKGTLALSGTSSIVRIPNNGTNGSGATNGNGGAAMTVNDMGSGLIGQAGVAGPGGGLGGSSGAPGNNAGVANGYGGAGGSSGSAGSGGTAGTAGTYTNVPERVIRQDHIYLLNYKNGGQGGAGGAGGAAAALGQGGGGGGGGSGGGVIIIFAQIFNNTSSVGITCKGGNGGTGGNATAGNSNGGGGGGGGGGGHIYIICVTQTAIGTLSVAGGTAGTGGVKNGTGSNGGNGSAGSAGHTEVFNALTNTWTVT